MALDDEEVLPGNGTWRAVPWRERGIDHSPYLLRVIKELPPAVATRLGVADRTGVANRHTKENRPGRSLPRTASHKAKAVKPEKSVDHCAVALSRAFVKLQVATPGHNKAVT